MKPVCTSKRCGSAILARSIPRAAAIVSPAQPVSLILGAEKGPALFFRIGVITAFCALLLAPVWVANDGVDRLFASQGGRPSVIAMSGIGDDVLERLGGVRTEIRADICRRGE